MRENITIRILLKRTPDSPCACIGLVPGVRGWTRLLNLSRALQVILQCSWPLLRRCRQQPYRFWKDLECLQKLDLVDPGVISVLGRWEAGGS